MFMDSGISESDQFVKAMTKELDAAPHHILRLAEEAGYRVVFTARRVWQLEEFRDAKYLTRLQLFLESFNASAVSINTEDVRFRIIAFRPQVLTVSHKSSCAAVHELGHAVDTILGLSQLPEVVQAWRKESGMLGPPFDTDIREFVGEAVGLFCTQERMLATMPRIHGIIRERDRALRERFGMLMEADGVSDFYNGPEGAAGYVPASDTITVMLRLDGEGTRADIFRDGTILVRESKSRKIGPVMVFADRQVEMEESKASRLRAFLRSKGFTLPHVMS